MKNTDGTQVVAVLFSQLLLATAGWAQWSAFNDLAPGAGTHSNATRYHVFGYNDGTNGPLRDIRTGMQTPVRLTLSRIGTPASASSGTNPAAGTPLAGVFDGFVDFGGSPTNSPNFRSTSASVTYTFSGLNPTNLYSLRAGALSLYTAGDCWTLVSLGGAESFLPAHSSGVLTDAQRSGLASNQVVAPFAGPNAPTRGEMVGWDRIAPGADGTFSLVCAGYSLSGYPVLSSLVVTGLRLATEGSEPLTLVSHPTSQALMEGERAALRVEVVGAPVFCQWYKDGEPLAGATEPTLALSAARPSDAGNYQVVVSNSCTVLTSRIAFLTVGPLRPVVITNQPADLLLTNGMTARWDAGVEGDPPLTWQWFKDGWPLPDATNAELLILSAAPCDTGLYSVRVANPTNSTFSSNAALTVVPWPVGGPSTVDTNFMGVASLWIRAMLALSNGSIYLGGAFAQYDGVDCSGLARINPYGRLDRGFLAMSNGGVTYALTVQPDGKLLAGGSYGVVRLLTHGASDPAFVPASFHNGTVRQIAVQPDGRLLVAGEFSAVGSSSRPNLARLNADGSLDPTFNPGTGPNSMVRALLLLEDGRMWIGGLFTNYNGVSQSRLARVTSTGELDATFLPGTNAANGAVYFLTLSGDRILVAGEFTALNGAAISGVARLYRDGSLDPTFRTVGGVLGGPVYTITQQDYGQLVIGGAFTQVAGVPRSQLARLNADGSLDPHFQISFAESTGVQNWILSSVSVPGGDVLISGLFYAVNQVSGRFLARLVGRGGPFLRLDQAPGGSPRLAWPTNAAGFVPQSRPTIWSGEWRTEEASPVVVGEWNLLDLAPTNQSQFFRLFKP